MDPIKETLVAYNSFKIRNIELKMKNIILIIKRLILK